MESRPIITISRRKFLEASLLLAWLKRPGRARPKPSGTGREQSRLKSDGPSGAFFGAQTHFGQFRTGVDAILDLIKDAGIAWIRDEVYWSQVEREKGAFRFPSSYDEYLRSAQARGIQVLLILDFGNALYSGGEKVAPATEAERAAFGRYCTAVVKRYQPLGVRNFEIWNEPNASTFWKPLPCPEDYAKVLETAYKSCKDADPEATVIGCSTSGTDLDFIGRVIAAGGGPFMDAVSFHPYCQPMPPEKKLLTDIAKLKGIVPEKPLWITEVGYPTYKGPSGVDEETQANYLVRTFLLARASPAVARVFWYDFQNDGEDPEEGEFNFGIVRTDRTPKPAYRAFKTTTLLAGNLPVAELRVAGNTYLLSFGEKHQVIAAWRISGTESVDIPLAKGRYQIVERDGESRVAEVTGSVLELVVSEAPRFILTGSHARI